MPPRTIPVFVQRLPKPRSMPTARKMIGELFEILSKTSDVFDLLRSAVNLLRKVEGQAGIQEVYIELADKLGALNSVAAAYSEDGSSDENLQARLNAIALALITLANATTAKPQPPQADIEAAFRRVSSLLDVFQFTGQIKVKTLLTNILQRLGTLEERKITDEDSGPGIQVAIALSNPEQATILKAPREQDQPARGNERPLARKSPDDSGSVGNDVGIAGGGRRPSPPRRNNAVDIFNANTNDNNVIAGNNAKIDIQNQNTINNYLGPLQQQHPDDWETIDTCLRDYYVSDALHDKHPAEADCTKGTRVRLLEDAKNLVTSNRGAKIVWVTGMAGTGKTTIALTLCQMLGTGSAEVALGTFFCSRSADGSMQTDVRCIIPTLARQMAKAIPNYDIRLAEELRKEPELARQPVGIHVDRLLHKPLRGLKLGKRRIVFVIDALDACSDQHQLLDLLDALGSIDDQAVKTLITSRPDLRISKSITWNPGTPSFLQLPTTDPQVTKDIRLFIQKAFECSSTTSAWYTEEELDFLAKLANGLFAFAAITVTYILGPADASARSERLYNLALPWNCIHAELEQMYLRAMTQAGGFTGLEPASLAETCWIVTIMSNRAPSSIKALADLIGFSRKQLHDALNKLHAVISVPKEDEKDELLTLHPTLVDFLVSRAPSDINNSPYAALIYQHSPLKAATPNRLGLTQPLPSVARESSQAVVRRQLGQASPTGFDPARALLDSAKLLMRAGALTAEVRTTSTPQTRARPAEGVIQDMANAYVNVIYAGHKSLIRNYNSVNVRIEQPESDAETIEKYLVRPYHVPRTVHNAQPTNICMAGTRVQFLAHAKAVVSTRGGANIVWISGTAGTGKTTVASTLCQQLSSDPTVLVGGTFFCSRSVIERTEVRRIIPTLATLLFRAIPACTEALAAELRKEPELGSKSIPVQFEGLLAKPLGSLGSFDRQIVFVIDALDQCSDHEQLVELINAFADLKSPVPVKFLLTSRPAPRIRELPSWNPSLPSFLHLSISDPYAKDDIRLFIQKTFEKSLRASTSYTSDDLTSLATLADGSFVFAAVVIKYILHRDPPQRLQKVKTQTGTPALTNTLVEIYTLVLNEFMNSAGLEPDELERGRKIIAAIVSRCVPLCFKTLADVLGLSSEQLRAALDELHAVVHVPEADEEDELRVLHPTFVDFLFGPASDYLGILQSYSRDTLAQYCLERLDADDLCFNVSRSQSSYDINPIGKAPWIAPSLLYACMHWGRHVVLASCSLDDRINSILRRKLLFWLEIMSVVGEVDLACELLVVVTKVVQLEVLRDFLRDGISFIVSSRQAIEFSAAHIYISAVPFTPKHSLIRQAFSPLLKGVVCVEALGIGSFSTGKAIAAASSADRRVIASAASDGSIRAWDTVVRKDIGTWTPMHKGGVQSVAVSADGRLIATGSADGVVRLWDSSKAQHIGPPFGGHGGRVGAIAFSPDGKCLVSGCDDNIVRVWEVETGRQLHSMTISSSVSSVAYSPDGRMIGAGDASGNLHLYNVKSYRETKCIECDIDIKSLVFAPDSGFVLVASDNDVLGTSFGTITSTLVASGHTARVNAVAYSPDGKFIVSGADDATVRLWDAKSGKPRGPVLHGHSGPVLSVVFSPTGHSVVTAGVDGAIRTWDLEETKSISLRLRRLVSPTTPHYANGWILTPSPSSKPLILVPSTYREQFGDGDDVYGGVAAHHFMLTSIASDTLYYGERWTECWRGGS